MNLSKSLLLWFLFDSFSRLPNRDCNSAVTIGSFFDSFFALPNRDAILRPIDSDRVMYMSDGMESCGFRRYEPCCITDPLPEIGIKRYILGGNHRVASTRSSG